MLLKGGGSAYGGKWKPSKPEDERLIGKPGEIKITFKPDGTKVETKIGPDGFAERERHHTSAPNPKYHTNPHDHVINWHTPREGMPNFGKPIDYWDGNPPEFKAFLWSEHIIYSTSTPEDNRFKTISEFKECIIRGGEVIFSWRQAQYGVFKNELRYCIALADGEQKNGVIHLMKFWNI